MSAQTTMPSSLRGTSGADLDPQLLHEVRALLGDRAAS